MKLIHDRFGEEQTDGTKVAYFFNARALRLLEKSRIGMYRSLVYQLLEAFPHLQNHFLKTFSRKEKGGNIDESTVSFKLFSRMSLKNLRASL